MSNPLTHRQPSRYDKTPSTRLPDDHKLWKGLALWEELARFSLARSQSPVIAIDTYPGVDLEGLAQSIRKALPGFTLVDLEDAAARPLAEIDALIDDHVTDDRVFGVLSHHSLRDYYDESRLSAVAAEIEASGQPTIVIGWGATLAPIEFHCIVIADLARWEIQKRQRAGAPNWRRDNGGEDQLRKYKRGFFIDWRIADRHKRTLFEDFDFLLDTNASMNEAKLIESRTFHEGMQRTASGPFRVVPFFDPGVWGGQWMKEVCGLDDTVENYAWCFDCVPEENSLLLSVAGELVEVPSIDVVFTQPRELLGELIFARFGAEFPIRFDLLDTMSGGNLSLQVHPLTGYIQDRFGMHYTQDESYYLLDAAEEAVVYLGVKSGVDHDEMLSSLESASEGGDSFPADRFINQYPAKKHDHFSIPSGTIHCSGANSMVLEISSTPFIFTFKMWDWDRLGLDGRPRPIHLDHAKANIEWDRDTEWVDENLIDQTEPVASGEGWVEERTGLHQLEFIEVRRHWFTDTVPHDTRGTVNVLNLVEGAEAIVESPSGAFAPFVVHYAETFIVPASTGHYTIRPHGVSVGKKLATVKASVRGTEL